MRPSHLRLAYAALLAATVTLGLLSRRYPDWQPEFVAAYAGDVLWAAMVYWIGAFIWPTVSRRWIASGAVAVAALVEVSQLYHAPWIDAVRASRAASLVLGRGFLWSDLVCYAAGVAGAAVVDALLVRGVDRIGSRRRKRVDDRANGAGN